MLVARGAIGSQPSFRCDEIGCDAKAHGRRTQEMNLESIWYGFWRATLPHGWTAKRILRTIEGQTCQLPSKHFCPTHS